jgi:hypothetical protein
MFCKECKAENKKSKVYVGSQTTTLLGWFPYYDEDGEFHNHDPNTITTNYSCSNGHIWSEKTKSKCMTCKE